MTYVHQWAIQDRAILSSLEEAFPIVLGSLAHTGATGRDGLVSTCLDKHIQGFTVSIRLVKN
jgi:hypothetical protein